MKKSAWTTLDLSDKIKAVSNKKGPKTKVALLFGGRSAEHDISLLSAASIYINLNRKLFDIFSFYINPDGLWKRVKSPLLSKEELIKDEFLSFLPWDAQNKEAHDRVDIYFPVLHGPYGEDGTIQGLLEMADVPYVGSGVLSSAGCMDKGIARDIFKANGFPAVKHLILHEGIWRSGKKEILKKISEEFELPIFVKPANMGSSIGISKVDDSGKTAEAVESALEFDRKVIVEQGVAGRELECSVLGNEDPQVSLPGEILPSREFYDYRDKYIEGKTQFIIPAPLSPEISGAVQALALAAYKALECSGMARIDFFLEYKTDRIFLSEINTIPGFTEISMYPKLWEASGIPLPELLTTLIDLGLSRHRQKKRKRARFQP